MIDYIVSQFFDKNEKVHSHYILYKTNLIQYQITDKSLK